MKRINDILNMSTLASLIDNKYVSNRTHPDYPHLHILNYTHLAEYNEDIWDDTLSWCRGLIYDDTDNRIVALPFKKFWNLNHRGHPECAIENLPDEMNPLVLEKMDGVLGIIFKYDNKLHVASRGSFSSDMAIWATNWIRNTHSDLNVPEDHTLLAEIIYPGSHIIVNYDFSNLIAIGLMNIESAKEESFETLSKVCKENNFTCVKRYHKTLEQTISENIQNREGYVITYSNRLKVKVKFEEYLYIARLMQSQNGKNLLESYRSNPSVLRKIYENSMAPNSYKLWMTLTINSITQRYQTLVEESQNSYKNVTGMDRKSAAKWMYENISDRDVIAVTFKMIDLNGEIPFHIIWKVIKQRYISSLESTNNHS